MPFTCLVTDCLPNEAVGGRNGQCFGFYTYLHDRHTRTENITDWAVKKFRGHYNDPELTKWDIFHYVYAMLHHPTYRARFAQNLKKEIPRLPLAKDFQRCCEIGRTLKELHLTYEQVVAYKLEWIEAPNETLSYRVSDRMHLDKEAGKIQVNNSLTLAGIPPEAFEYVLGTRSALEWIVDQYRYYTDPHTGVISDPNDATDEQFIVRLIERITSISLSTVRLLKGLRTEIEFASLASEK
jgi:predicted helicase